MKPHPEGKDDQPRRKTILIVDDDPVIHELYTLFLENEPVDLIHDYDGRNVPQLLGKRRPDLILLDIGIPGTDGRDICRSIKQDSRNRNIPIIMVTGNDDSCIREKGLEFGPDDFIAKPATRRYIMHTLNKYLQWTPL